MHSDLPLCLTKHHAMKMYWWSEVYLHALSTLALDASVWLASRLGSFTSEKIPPGTYFIEDWVGQSRSGCGGEEESSQALPGMEP